MNKANFDAIILNLSHVEFPSPPGIKDAKGVEKLVEFYRALGKELDAFLQPVQELPALSGVPLPQLITFSDYLEDYIIPELNYTIQTLEEETLP